MLRETNRINVLAHGFSSANYGDRINTWANEAQRKIFREVKMRAGESSATLPTTANVSTLALPSDFEELISLFNISSNPAEELHPTIDEDEFDSLVSETGTPFWFRIVGSNIYLSPTPDSTYSIRLRYWKLPTDLSADGQSFSVPEQWCYLIELYCLYRSYASEGDVEMSNFHKNSFETDLVSMAVHLQSDADKPPKQVPGGWQLGYP